ncbi:MAG: hypothetical protein HY393_00410 [Candidatus Diapherotrites archaeon]|nr:hypothetical protein [Candidatus Diapherotrites archaeon]
MSAAYDSNPPFIEPVTRERLQAYLKRSWLKRDSTAFNSSSVALTQTSAYYSGLWESRSHLLDVTSEQGALARAASCKDAGVRSVITLVDTQETFQPNPLVVKVLADHERRTGQSIHYQALDLQGKILYAGVPSKEFYYQPKQKILERARAWKQEKNALPVAPSTLVIEQLRNAALKGMECHFGTSNEETRYGAGVRADDTIYFAGVYSSFDHRLNVHAEMSATLSAVMDGHQDISWVGIVSTKFKDVPVRPCGCCLQFLSEIQQKTGKEISIAAFASDTNAYEVSTLQEYLPLTWHSGESLEEKTRRKP